MTNSRINSTDDWALRKIGENKTQRKKRQVLFMCVNEMTGRCHNGIILLCATKLFAELEVVGDFCQCNVFISLTASHNLKNQHSYSSQ